MTSWRVGQIWDDWFGLRCRRWRMHCIYICIRYGCRYAVAATLRDYRNLKINASASSRRRNAQSSRFIYGNCSAFRGIVNWGFTLRATCTLEWQCRCRWERERGEGIDSNAFLQYHELFCWDTFRILRLVTGEMKSKALINIVESILVFICTPLQLIRHIADWRKDRRNNASNYGR